ncbi:PH domain-containing protein [Geomicrobium sp. JCM 19038]|uniref:PH domain-containing protein n=1 Tax=Geomicrobium sp. JCM 19038 TaxID=1460635 RepID=UPI0005AB6B70|nr:PH domain-containing protein [Geomicrobium sp. JCM 19038]
MTFRSRVDKRMVVFIIVVMMSVVSLAGSTLFFSVSTLWVWLPFIFLIVVVALCFWMLMTVKYVITEQQLNVQAGPIKNTIPYEKITRIERFRGLGYTSGGYKLHLAGDGFEIFYSNGWFGSVRISPQQDEQFLKEIRRHLSNDSTDL